MFKIGDRIKTKGYVFVSRNSTLNLDKKEKIVKMYRKGYSPVPFLDIKEKCDVEATVVDIKKDILFIKKDDSDKTYQVSTWMVEGEE